MNAHSNLAKNYQEELNSLLVLHQDLDQKLTQPQFANQPDILKAVYLKVTLKSLSDKRITLNDLKPLDSLSKRDFLQAKLKYLADLKAAKMEEQETSDADIEDLLKLTLEDVQRYQNNPRKLPQAQEVLKELEFIKCVSYAL